MAVRSVVRRKKTGCRVSHEKDAKKVRGSARANVQRLKIQQLRLKRRKKEVSLANSRRLLSPKLTHLAGQGRIPTLRQHFVLRKNGLHRRRGNPASGKVCWGILVRLRLKGDLTGVKLRKSPFEGCLRLG